MSELLIVEDSYFNQLTNVDLKKYIKKKQKFSYFSWSDAHEMMKKYDPDAEIQESWFKHYELLSNDQGTFNEVISKQLPYEKTENSSFVEVAVVFKGKKESEIYPILDFRNQDVPNPTMTQVNKSLKRAFVKALAKHGLGLYIYRGEDIPETPTISLKDLEKVEKMIGTLNELTGQDTLPVLTKRTNEHLKQEFSHLGVPPIKEIETMDKNQYGVFLRVLNDATNKAKEKNKK